MKIHRVWSGVFSDEMDPNTDETVVIESEIGNLFLTIDQAEGLAASLETVAAVARQRKSGTFEEHIKQMSEKVSHWPEWKQNLLGKLKR